MGLLGERVKEQKMERPDMSVVGGPGRSNRETQERNTPVDIDRNQYRDKACFQGLYLNWAIGNVLPGMKDLYVCPT